MPITKTCKCGNRYEPIKMFNSTIKSNKCVKCLASSKRKKDWIKERKEMKKSLLTHSDYMQMLQVVFNTYIRERDKEDGCISCGTKTSKKYDAGHFYPTTFQFLRFHEDNVHRQCSFNCNMKKRGNLQEYRIRLIEKIGAEKVQWLEDNRHNKLELSIPNIIELISTYKFKTAEIKALK